MAKALDVATYLMQLASREDEADYLSPLRLQKLLYYCQGWHLGIKGKPLFSEAIRGWVYGPVVPEIYSHFANYGNMPIPEKEFQDKNPKLSKSECTFIQSVWEAYKKYSAISLKEMTHKEQPWLESRKGLAPTARGNKEMTHTAMRKFFVPANS